MKKIRKSTRLIIEFVSIIVIIILGFIIFLTIRGANDRSFNKKLNLLKEHCERYYATETEKNIILSVSDGNSHALTRYAKGNTYDIIFRKLSNDMYGKIWNEDYKAKYVRVDIIGNTSIFEKDVLTEKIANTPEGYFRFGIIWGNNYVPEAVLNSRGMIDYKTGKLNISRLNSFLGTNIDSMPDKIKIFNTISFLCDENNTIFGLDGNGDENTGRRIINDISNEDIKYVIGKSSEYLSNMVKDDKQFNYGYYALTDGEIPDYNWIHHAGATWALTNCYDLTCKNKNEYKDSIDKAIQILIDKIIEKNSDTIYISDDKITLGLQGLTLCALCDYNQNIDNTKYIDFAKKLGNGIISMQNSNGSYNQKLDLSFNNTNEYISTFYDGEATLGLVKLYEITKDDKYLNAAKKALDYFIDNDYLSSADHWQAYSANYISKYCDEAKYFEYGLKIIGTNIDSMLEKTVSNDTEFEKIMQVFEIYNRAIEKKIDFQYLKEFPKDKFIELINKKVQIQLTSFSYPETAMYFVKPDKYLNTFFNRKENCRIRIDDIQHSVIGMHFYLNNMDKIKAAN